MKLQGLSAALFFILWYIISKLFILSFVTAIVIYYVDMDGREYLTFVARGTTVATYRMEAALNKIMLKIQWKKFVSTTTNTPDTDGKVDLVSVYLYTNFDMGQDLGDMYMRMRLTISLIKKV